MHTQTLFVERRAVLLALASAACGLSQTTIAPPEVPAGLQPPAGHVAYLKADASGTQNYVCLPNNGGAGMAWKFQGPQATLFVTFRWITGEIRQQAMTHFLSPNPAETGMPARATWQSSADTSAVWARKVAESTDPAYVEPGAIPWILLEAAGTRRGPENGGMLVRTTFLQRVRTSGGTIPTGSCSETGAIAFVPYTAQYVFYRSAAGAN